MDNDIKRCVGKSDNVLAPEMIARGNDRYHAERFGRDGYTCKVRRDRSVAVPEMARRLFLMR